MKREVKSTESIGIVELDEVVGGDNVVEIISLELCATVVTVEESEVKCVREKKAVAMPDVAANEKTSATVNESLLKEVNGENRKIIGSQ